MATNTVSDDSRPKQRVLEELCDSDSSQLESKSGGGTDGEEDYEDEQDSAEIDEAVEVSPCGRFTRVNSVDEVQQHDRKRSP
jgi:hypothetical protein